jgi:hypothetical protein
MGQEIVPPNEETMIRCPRLGHQITFSYCRAERGELPCFKTLDCWFEHFDVEGYFRGRLTEAQWEKAFSRSGQNKLMSLLDLIEQAKQRMQPEDNSGSKS